jgi:hypothetical protein
MAVGTRTCTSTEVEGEDGCIRFVVGPREWKVGRCCCSGVVGVDHLELDYILGPYLVVMMVVGVIVVEGLDIVVVEVVIGH